MAERVATSKPTV